MRANENVSLVSAKFIQGNRLANQSATQTEIGKLKPWEYGT